MSLRNGSGRLALGCAIALALGGCRDEPKEPSTSDPGGPGVQNLLKDSRRMAKRKMKGKRVSPEAMKLYRLEICYFGTQALTGIRDVYQSSLAGGEPAAGKIPVLELDLPEPPPKEAKDDKGAAPTTATATAQATAKPAATADPAAKAAPKVARKDGKDGRLDAPRRPGPATTRHLRSCTIAKKLKQPPAPELDAALTRFEEYVVGLNKSIGDAKRYYGRKEYEEDKFKRGKELHKELTDQFSKLDEQLTAFDKAYQTWRADQKPAPDELNEGGEAAEQAVTKARELTALIWGSGEKDADKLTASIAALTKNTDALEQLRKKDGASTHAKLVPAALRRLIDASEQALEQVKANKLTPSAQIQVVLRMIDVLEANHRALARMLNPKAGRGDAKGMRLKPPRRGPRLPVKRKPRPEPAPE